MYIKKNLKENLPYRIIFEGKVTLKRMRIIRHQTVDAEKAME